MDGKGSHIRVFVDRVTVASGVCTPCVPSKKRFFGWFSIFLLFSIRLQTVLKRQGAAVLLLQKFLMLTRFFRQFCFLFFFHSFFSQAASFPLEDFNTFTLQCITSKIHEVSFFSAKVTTMC